MIFSRNLLASCGLAASRHGQGGRGRTRNHAVWYQRGVGQLCMPISKLETINPPLPANKDQACVPGALLFYKYLQSPTAASAHCSVLCKEQPSILCTIFDCGTKSSTKVLASICWLMDEEISIQRPVPAYGVGIPAPCHPPMMNSTQVSIDRP